MAGGTGRAELSFRLPRAYQLTYTPELATLVNGVVEELAAGNSIAGTMNQRRRDSDTAERLPTIRAQAKEANTDGLGERYSPSTLVTCGSPDSQPHHPR